MSPAFIALLLSLLISTSCQAERILKACGHPFYPPVSWHSNGELTGLAPAVSRQLFAELGYQVQLSADSNWKRCLLEVEQGNADIVVAAFRTQQRQTWLHFSQIPIIADPITLFINSQQPLPYKTLNDLKGKTVGLLLGDSFGDTIDNFIQRHNSIEYVSQGKQNFAKLAAGRIDYMPLGQLSGDLQRTRLGFSGQVRALDTIITTEHYYLALGKHSQLQQHLPYLNQRLREMQQDGTLAQLTRQYSLHYLNQAKQ